MAGKAAPTLNQLLEALHGIRSRTRQRAALSLRSFHCEQAAEALRRALADKHPAVRLAAAQSLAILYALPIDLPDLAVLLERLASSDPVRRDSAIRGLRSLVAEPLPG
ncbi:MAG: HEAT repeat domain-containing protein [Bradymonadales bacterium]|nr:HEAT repeat domain-containing protein [Bradymonadales bacterium]